MVNHEKLYDFRILSVWSLLLIDKSTIMSKKIVLATFAVVFVFGVLGILSVVIGVLQPWQRSATTVDGGWSQWGPWPDTCSDSCGEMERLRVCDSPRPGPGGKYCEGRNVEIQPCPCPGKNVITQIYIFTYH